MHTDEKLNSSDDKDNDIEKTIQIQLAASFVANAGLNFCFWW